MFQDLRKVSVPTKPIYDVCIVGGGAAGITLALELSDSNFRICVLESGGASYEQATQNLYRGKVTGLQYPDLATCRLRYFGGTTNHWTGYCNVHPEYSFETRDWIPESGWPISSSDVSPYYERAHGMLEFEKVAWNPNIGWDADEISNILGDPSWPIAPELFFNKADVIKPVRMGEVFRETLEAKKDIDIFLNANVVNINANVNGTAVSSLKVATLNNDFHEFHAKNYVIAAGGIENARLLLNSNNVQQEGLGNQNDMVGRFFSDHVHIFAGFTQPSDQSINIKLYDRRSFGNSKVEVSKVLRLETQRKHRLVPAGIVFKRGADSGTTLAKNSMRSLVGSLKRGSVPDNFETHIRNVTSSIDQIANFGKFFLWNGQAPVERINLKLYFDPAPNRNSRILLNSEVDSLGLRQVTMDWRLTDIDRRTIAWLTNWVATNAPEAGLGRVKLDFDPASPDDAVSIGYHHNSTTRMADDPKDGVVDRNCKVHGFENLYMAGSSVFSTAGWGQPTFLIVALAIRLADHLKSKEVS